MPFFYNEEDYKTLVFLDEATINVVDKKYKDKPVIVIRSSYEHQQGNENTRSSHGAAIKLKRGDEYGKNVLEVYTRDKNDRPIPTLPTGKDFKNKNDRKITVDFVKRYYLEIERIYNAKPNTKEYNDAVDDLLSKNNGKYIMKRSIK